MAVMLQVNKQAMPQDRFLAMGRDDLRGMGDEEEAWWEDHPWMELGLMQPFPRSSLPFYVFPYSQRNIQKTLLTDWEDIISSYYKYLKILWKCISNLTTVVRNAFWQKCWHWLLPPLFTEVEADTSPSVTLLHVTVFPHNLHMISHQWICLYLSSWCCLTEVALSCMQEVLKNGVGFITLCAGVRWPQWISSVGREAPE